MAIEYELKSIPGTIEVNYQNEVTDAQAQIADLQRRLDDQVAYAKDLESAHKEEVERIVKERDIAQKIASEAVAYIPKDLLKQVTSAETLTASENAKEVLAEVKALEDAQGDGQSDASLRNTVKKLKGIVLNQEKIIDQFTVSLGMTTKVKQEAEGEVKRLQDSILEKNRKIATLEQDKLALISKHQNEMRNMMNMQTSTASIYEHPDYRKVKAERDEYKIQTEELGRRLNDLFLRTGRQSVKVVNFKHSSGKGFHLALLDKIVESSGHPFELVIKEDKVAGFVEARAPQAQQNQMAAGGA
nr:hypothetical protein [uncultured Nitrososphaera sp.]